VPGVLNRINLRIIIEENKYRKSGMPLGVEIPAPARTTIRLKFPFFIDSISLSAENDFAESRRAELRIRKTDE
jgi:hypothetical protein